MAGVGEEHQARLLLTALPAAEATRLARRLAGMRGWQWPHRHDAVQSVAGFTADLTGAGPDAAVWGTIHEDDGLFGVFRGSHLLAMARCNLGAIERVQAVRLPGTAYLSLMVDDVRDSMDVGFSREECRHIYTWDGRALREVFQGELCADRFRHARWRNRRAPYVWRLWRTLGDATLHDGLLVYTRREQQLEAPGYGHAPVPPVEAFRLQSEDVTVRHYTWNSRLLRFETISALPEGWTPAGVIRGFHRKRALATR